MKRDTLALLSIRVCPLFSVPKAPLTDSCILDDFSCFFWTLQITFCHPQEVLSLCHCGSHVCVPSCAGSCWGRGLWFPTFVQFNWGGWQVAPVSFTPPVGAAGPSSWEGCVPWGVWWTVFHEAGVMERQPPDQSLLQTQKWLQEDLQCKHPLGLMWLQRWAGLQERADEMGIVFMQVWEMPCSWKWSSVYVVNWSCAAKVIQSNVKQAPKFYNQSKSLEFDSIIYKEC